MTFRLLLSFLLLSQQATVASAACNACLFDGEDPASCIIYGKVDDEVIEWNSSTRECRAFFDIAIASLDPNTSCQSTNAFVNSLKFGDLASSTSKLGLGVSSDGGAFFTQDDSNRVVLEASITIDGETTNCETSESGCYSKMNGYFSEGDGAKEMADVCEKLYNQVRVDRNLEESTLRNRICFELAEGSVVPLDCNPLAVQVGDVRTSNPEQDCSGYGFETPLSSVPGCEDVLETAEDGTTTLASDSDRDTPGSSSSSLRSLTWKWMAAVGGLVYSLA